MEVKVYAFELFFGKGVCADVFFNHLRPEGIRKAQSVASQLEKSGAPTSAEILLIDTPASHPDYISGLFLTIKDAKAFCGLKGKGGKLEMSAKSLEAGTAMSDFNFFVLNRKTCRGLYQHYHQSKAATTFCRELGYKYSEYREQLIKEEASKLLTENRRLSEGGAIRKAKKKFARFMESNIITRPESMPDLIQDLRMLNKLVIEPKSYKNYTKFARSHTGLLKRVKQTLYFEKHQNVLSECKDFAASLIKTGQLKSATAVGLDINGNEATLKLNNDYQVLTYYDYNDVVAAIDVDDIAATVETAPMIKELLNLTGAGTIKALLETPAK